MTLRLTKYVHSCLLVETPDRTALFDPGNFSADALPVDDLVRLDDIFITHRHADHCDIDLLKRLVARFPGVRITSNSEVVTLLNSAGIKASDQAPEGVSFFESPHENVAPVSEQPKEIGFHYLSQLSNPGDSHSFSETMPVLALPITGPWGSAIRALNLAIELKPQHVVPIHDWHWRDEARRAVYDRYADILAERDITLHKIETGEPIQINL